MSSYDKDKEEYTKLLDFVIDSMSNLERYRAKMKQKSHSNSSSSLYSEDSNGSFSMNEDSNSDLSGLSKNEETRRLKIRNKKQNKLRENGNSGSVPYNPNTIHRDDAMDCADSDQDSVNFSGSSLASSQDDDSCDSFVVDDDEEIIERIITKEVIGPDGTVRMRKFVQTVSRKRKPKYRVNEYSDHSEGIIKNRKRESPVLLFYQRQTALESKTSHLFTCGIIPRKERDRISDKIVQCMEDATKNRMDYTDASEILSEELFKLDVLERRHRQKNKNT
jgi:hypothetical protein